MIACILGVSKKTGKPIKSRKPEKKTEKTEPKKKPIKFLKKPAGSVRFWFYKQKTEPNPTKNRKKNRAKPEKTSQTEKNRAKTGKN